MPVTQLKQAGESRLSSLPSPPGPLRRFTASATNGVVAFVVVAPLWWAGWPEWRLALVAVFFLAEWCGRRRCLGCYVAGLLHERPATLLYVCLYTAGFSTLVYSLWITGDLLLLNAGCQVTALRLTGETAHGWLAGQRSRIAETMGVANETPA